MRVAGAGGSGFERAYSNGANSSVGGERVTRSREKASLLAVTGAREAEPSPANRQKCRKSAVAADSGAFKEKTPARSKSCSVPHRAARLRTAPPSPEARSTDSAALCGCAKVIHHLSLDEQVTPPSAAKVHAFTSGLLLNSMDAPPVCVRGPATLAMLSDCVEVDDRARMHYQYRQPRVEVEGRNGGYSSDVKVRGRATGVDARCDG